ncbi:phosphopentomutase-like [Ostrea edulis]|uniref:phosphopentomutase-like n=1 Tax=Ostrea edulis TaxID=37623 RepID=UPI0024AFBC05|nr:phosphopentomutase-like [Ostrea edulis]
MAGPTGDDEVDSKLQEWLNLDRNESTRAEIQQIVDKGNVEHLRRVLLKRMEFGTAGLRSRMGAGFSQMNDVTIIQTSQGLSKYLLKTCPEVKKKGVVIGYDGRYNSQRFASLAAAVLIHDEIPVYLFSAICPTPYVPYSVLHYKTECGIMVTASHNPKDDNGYKVYWGNGAQIISPTDKGIAESILQNLEILDSSWATSTVRSSPLCKDPSATILEAYNKDLSSLCYFKEKNQCSPVTFTYTAMHGVGYEFVRKACHSFGFVEPIPVQEQILPDPDFPTVKYPNPEEGEGALLLAMKTADENNSQVILANDPDADRLAIAEKLPDGKWHIFSGNETGALFGWWSWFSFVQRYPEFPVSDLYMLASTVSSKILQTIGNKEGFNFEETLTGFKWMGNLATELQTQGKTVLFAFEEAIGFMCGTHVLDKDGVSAAMVMSELATYLYNNGTTLYNKLEEIYKTYGYHLSNNSYYICHEPDKIKQMFEEIRNYNNTGKYPASCGQYKIKYIRDLTVGYDNSKPDCKPVLPVSKSSQMITFTFENGCVATLRTSGTEPKIKYYTEVKPDPQKGMDRLGAQKELDDIVKCIIKFFYQPEKFGFIPRPL